MCTPGDAAANGKGIGSIGDGRRTGGHKLDPLGGCWLLLPILRLVDKMKTPAPLTDGI